MPSSSIARTFVCGFVAALAMGLSSSSAALASCSSGLQKFLSTGTEQCYTVPAGVSELHVVAVSGSGGGGLDGSGGFGAQVTADIPATPGATLYIEVGVGGGTGVLGAGSGGGASDVQTCSSATCADTGGAGDPRLVVAGGGGGAGGGSGPTGGGGGNGGVGGAGLFSCEPGGSAGDGAAVDPNFGSGGGGGTCSIGGIGGTAGFGDGTTGMTGSPGAGGSSTGGSFGGGGGGGGYWGGGSGGSGGQNASGGGGGGGSSFGPAGAELAMASSTTPSLTIGPTVATLAVASPYSVYFPGTQPLTTISSRQTLTISNAGSVPLTISGLSFAGSDPHDFYITSYGCPGSIATGASCSMTLIFAPMATGNRSALLKIASNDPAGTASVSLFGKGGQLPKSPPSSTNPKGSTSKIELVTCKQVTKRVKEKVKGKTRKVKVHEHVCTDKAVSGRTSTTGDRASISRGRHVYATGTGTSTGSGRLRLVLTPPHSLRAGHYTLTLHIRRGRKSTTQRLAITIT